MSLRVLIVDDSPIIRSVIEKNVKLAEIDVDACIHAGNGREALGLLADEWIDLIFLDINMPVMGGVEMVQHMSKDGLLKTIPVVIVSTEGSETRIQDLKDLGVAGYLRKPFTPEQFKSIANQVLERRDAA